MQERVKRISAFEKATQMEVLRRDEAQSSDFLEKPFLADSMPSPKSPKLSGAGMQFRNVSTILKMLSYAEQNLNYVKGLTND